jgi:hypothetical protein
MAVRLHNGAGREFDEREHHLLPGRREDVNAGEDFVARAVGAGDEVGHGDNFGF